MALNKPDALEAVELFLRQAVANERVVHLFRTPADRPLGLEGRKRLPELAAVHFVAARIRSAVFHVLDRAARYDFLDDVRHVFDLIVFFRAADVECLVVDELARRLEYSQKRPRDVFDMDERPPRRAVALDEDFAGRERHAR